jgi:hypothetical protein
MSVILSKDASETQTGLILAGRVRASESKDLVVSACVTITA